MSGECQTKNKLDHSKDKDEKPIIALDEGNKLVAKSFKDTTNI